jgi:Undecaprenyl-phosphate glucose phosphotransferase
VLKRQHQLFVTLLAIADAAVIVAACYAAWAFRRHAIEGFPARSWENWLIHEPLTIFVVPVTLSVMWMCGLYRPRRDRARWLEQLEVLRASLFSVAFVVVILWAIGNDQMMGRREPYGPFEFFGHDFNTGQTQIGALAVFLPVFLCAHRLAFRLALGTIRKRGWNLRHVAIIGVGRVAHVACRTLERNGWTGIRVAYFISHEPQTERTTCLGRPVRGGLGQVEQTLVEHPVDAVFVALPAARAGALPDVLRRLERFSIVVRVVPDLNPRYLPQSMVVGELDGMPVLSYRESPMTGLGGIGKRAVDVVGALLAILLFSPVMLLCAAAVAYSSPGPVVFRQQRVSFAGRVFRIYKFRTMYDVHAEQDEPSWTRRGDPRITPVGRLLRRASLDELPQLFNVVRGEMSLVGPRPERPELIERFRDRLRGYMVRQHVKAGITGWAQVHGLRGDTSLARRVKYDLFYIRHWSLWLDLRILLLTLLRGFYHRNAH